MYGLRNILQNTSLKARGGGGGTSRVLISTTAFGSIIKRKSRKRRRILIFEKFQVTMHYKSNKVRQANPEKRDECGLTDAGSRPTRYTERAPSPLAGPL